MMRLVSRREIRRGYRFIKHDIPIKQMDEEEFVAMKKEALKRNNGHPVIGVPVYWSRVGTALEFWPLRDVNTHEIVDLDYYD